MRLTVGVAICGFLAVLVTGCGAAGQPQAGEREHPTEGLAVQTGCRYGGSVLISDFVADAVGSDTPRDAAAGYLDLTNGAAMHVRRTGAMSAMVTILGAGGDQRAAVAVQDRGHGWLAVSVEACQ